MEVLNKKVIVSGLGKSGIAASEFLVSHGAVVYAYDNKEKNENTVINKNIHCIYGQNPSGEEDCDFVVISPGIPSDLPFVIKFKARKIPVISEVELAYRFAKGTFLGVTGTNGKTTTTTILGEFLKASGFDTRVVGNIGNPVISEVESSTPDTFFVCELSSFQLENTDSLHLKAAGFLNLTADHLNRHGSMENYGKVKSRIFNNQTAEDFAVLNYNDPYLRKIYRDLKAEIIWIDAENEVSNGYFIKDGNIVLKKDGDTKVIMSRSDVALRGNHNMENVLTAMAIANSVGCDMDAVKTVLKKFKGVTHRMEEVGEVNGAVYINDSKGTNPDASVKALDAFHENIVLIAGGMDKKVPFDNFIEAFNGKVRKLILLGETKNIIATCAKTHGFNDIIFVSDMEEAVKEAHKNAVKGDIVLLSPACASWDMYESFEVRGDDFKTRVRNLEGFKEIKSF